MSVVAPVRKALVSVIFERGESEGEAAFRHRVFSAVGDMQANFDPRPKPFVGFITETEDARSIDAAQMTEIRRAIGAPCDHRYLLRDVCTRCGEVRP